MAITDMIILHGGELSQDIANRVETKLHQAVPSISIRLTSMSKPRDFKPVLESPPSTLVVFILSTIENEAPPEDAGACVRFLKRKTQPPDLLLGKFQFAVLGLGDTNLLLDRQHTTAKDCNQVAQFMDGRLEALGGSRYCGRGEADEHGVDGGGAVY